MCEERWLNSENNSSASIWASCSRNMPGRTDSIPESGRATAPPSTSQVNSSIIDNLPRYPGSSRNSSSSDQPSPNTPRYTPNYSNFNFFAKPPKEENKFQEEFQLLGKHKQDCVTDSLLSFLQKKGEDSCTKESGKRRRKENAMSHYPEEAKRLGYDYHQWDFRADGASGRRGHLPFQGHGWGPMAMGNPYFPNPHMVPAHAHSTPDYRFNQWTPPAKLAHAHSQHKLPPPIKSSETALLDPLTDLQALVSTREQHESVDLRLPGAVTHSPEKPVPLTVHRQDPVEKEISSTNDSTSPVAAVQTQVLEPPVKKVESPVKSLKSPTPSPSPPALEPSEPSSPKIVAMDIPNGLDEKEVSNDNSSETKTETSVPMESTAEKDSNLEQNNGATQENVPQVPTESPKLEAQAPEDDDPKQPTVSSTSTDVKPVTEKSAKKKRPAKKKSKPKEAKKVKVVKPVKTVPERRGPVLHLKGSREAPISVSVLNGPRGEDDDPSTSRSKAALPREFRQRTRARHGLYSSTLSAQYDARTADPTWVCVFCKLGPHREGLGDLFGPYVIVKEPPTELCDDSGDERDIVDAQRRGGRNKKSIRANNLLDYYQNMSGKLKRSTALDATKSKTGLKPLSDDEGDSPRYEVWVHEACVVWSPGVCMVDTRLLGLQEAVWYCQKEICSKCSQGGANLGCIHRNCPNRSHYICARDSGWSLPDDTFISTCHFHVQRT